MEKGKLIISYDREADVAYLSFGKPRPSVSEEVDRLAIRSARFLRRWAIMESAINGRARASTTRGMTIRTSERAVWLKLSSARGVNDSILTDILFAAEICVCI